MLINYQPENYSGIKLNTLFMIKFNSDPTFALKKKTI
jgi:hypothetical protein